MPRVMKKKSDWINETILKPEEKEMFHSGDIVSMTCFTNPIIKPPAWILTKQEWALPEHDPAFTSSHTTTTKSQS